ncbi:hypothetical protein NZ698_12080 [Chryseobacterium sp. PBS4-4]|uniref:Uncharacterized protein n=1 Tax=Chryseobacterium edaphi TaxID=2976532 RepID=A0ABT2W6V4_9FLAO|nr:hypothetical protein [Chryseobacterium edaphi]MCU7617938.1 hypothetical protein [Chryseobacterium edaphi]
MKTEKKIQKRLDLLKGNKLFNDQEIVKTKYDTEFYVCGNNGNEIEIWVSVISPNLIVTNAAYMNNTDEVDISICPVTIGTNVNLKGKRFFVYSVASSIEDNTVFALNVTLREGAISKVFTVSMILNDSDTGEIVQQINFI